MRPTHKAHPLCRACRSATVGWLQEVDHTRWEEAAVVSGLTASHDRSRRSTDELAPGCTSSSPDRRRQQSGANPVLSRGLPCQDPIAQTGRWPTYARRYDRHRPQRSDLTAQVVVRTTAVPEDSVEIVAARAAADATTARADGMDVQGRQGIVTGTHGKSTTTAMVGTIFLKQGLEPVFVGAGRRPAQELPHRRRPVDSRPARAMAASSARAARR